ncbi:MAG: stage V sporulation protein AD [Sulfobacillus acidophilus]|uniref:Stage V sporulation protein AD n=1 Tax=Sulfobacillus acidophilus TaxID=53633 RepID=A0A2T2WKT1_9FIRM|nr:MAG: stage V sporulation protein AD [Sulfobacillus acidophilus]
MAKERSSSATLLPQGVYIVSTGSVVGPKEGEGPLGTAFDRVWPDEGKRFSSYEKAEQQLLNEAYEVALEKSGFDWSDIDLVLGGDLLDQTISTNFTGRQHQRPLLGLFAACATFTEALGLGSMLVSGSNARDVIVSASSHHLTAERQFRFPLELGYQRPPTAAWTATAAGAAVLSKDAGPIQVRAVTFGRVIDAGGRDPNDMGSAMAPAAFDTIYRHLASTRTRTCDYDAIVTGDLGYFGLDMLKVYAQESGLIFGVELQDCGRLLYDPTTQDTHNGGSGPGCSACVFAGPLANRLVRGDWGRLLLVATGALFSPTTYQQGETIPCIAHAVELVAV